MKSLNVKWPRHVFHQKLADLAEIRPGDTVLDVGCGNGRTLPYLLERVGPGGRVVALDRQADTLRIVAEQHADAIASGALEIVIADITKPITLPDAMGDVIVCQNVLECVPDRVVMIDEMWRLLKPGGRLLLGHHDFDGVIIASSDRSLTRRLIHGYADSTGGWQDVSEGQMGRLLPGLVNASRFADAETETVLLVDFDFAENSAYANVFVNSLRDSAPNLGLEHEAVATWIAELEERVVARSFYFAIPWVYVTARK